MVYDFVPVDSEVSMWEKEAVRQALYDKKGSPITSRDLARIAGLPVGGTQVKVRRCVTELIRFQDCPIVAIAKGFMWAVHPNQLELYEARLRERAAQVISRADKVRELSKRWNE